MTTAYRENNQAMGPETREFRKAMHTAPAAQRGLTLIETLIVIVILLVGILSVMRLFPTGFGLIHSTQNSTIADQMAQQMLQTVQTAQGRPEGVYTSYYDSNGLLYFDPQVQPDDLTNYSNAAAANADRMHDVDKTRYISNETFNVPATAIGVPFPAHVLNFAPIYLPGGASVSDSQIFPFLQVVSADWNAIQGNSAPDPSDASGNTPLQRPQDYLTPGHTDYLIDYTGQKIAVPAAAYDQTFQFVVAYLDTSTPANVLQYSVTIVVPGTADATPYNGQNWFAPNVYTATASTIPNGTWIPGTARLFRQLKYMMPTFPSAGTVTAAFDADPYEYTLVNPNPAAGGAPSDLNIGALAFNPLAAGQTSGQAVKVRVTYTAYDWHILHEDDDASAGSVVRLTLHDLKKVGDVQADNTVWTGLVPSATPNYDIMMVDLDSGQMLPYTHADTVDLDSNPYNGSDVDVSFVNGRVQMPTAGLTNDPYKHVRFFYAGKADWAVALQMAPQRYFAYSTAAAVGALGQQATPNRYAVDPSVAALYFPLCDYGKQVVLHGVTYTDKSGNRDTVTSVPLLIKNTTDPTAINTAGGYVRVELTSSDQSNDNLANNPVDASQDIDITKPIAVQTVQGVSARALVIWRENNVWKQRALETALTDGPQ